MYELQQFVPSGGAFTGEYVPQQLIPQGIFSQLLGRPLHQTYGCGPSGSLGQRMPALLPFDVDPVALALANGQTMAGQYDPQQLMPQSLFGGLLGRHFGDTSYGGCGPSGSLGQGFPGSRFPLFGAPQGGAAGRAGSAVLPFSVDPVAQAYAQDPQLAPMQQLQFAPQAWQGNFPGGYGAMSPFDVDPVAAAYAYQQAQALQAML